MQTDARPNPHSVTLEDRQRLRITGVEDVDCFNEQVVALLTSAGALTVSGEGLQMSQLDLEQGRVEISGEISALEYAGKAPGRRGLFGRLLRGNAV